MKNIALIPELIWNWSEPEGKPVDAECVPIPLLVRISETGSIAQAAKEYGFSYRHTWGLIRDWEKRFLHPLVIMTRGRGSALSPLGNYLVQMDARMKKRLAAEFAAASEEARRGLTAFLSSSDSKLTLCASHDPILIRLVEELRAKGTEIELHTQGSGESLASFAAGRSEMAGFHCPQGKLGKSVWTNWKTNLDPDTDVLIRFVQRSQGLMFAPDNPLKICSIKDLTRSKLRFINRQIGSGTRTLFDLLLSAEGIQPDDVAGYSQEEFTHAAVAAIIASGAADVGLGVSASARRFGLGFLPLVSEDYFFATRREYCANPAIDSLLKYLASPEWADILSNTPGYEKPENGQRTIECDAAWRHASSE